LRYEKTPLEYTGIVDTMQFKKKEEFWQVEKRVNGRMKNGVVFGFNWNLGDFVGELGSKRKEELCVNSW
jgi:hypothetical protein